MRRNGIKTARELGNRDHASGIAAIAWPLLRCSYGIAAITAIAFDGPRLLE